MGLPKATAGQTAEELEAWIPGAGLEPGAQDTPLASGVGQGAGAGPGRAGPWFQDLWGLATRSFGGRWAHWHLDVMACEWALGSSAGEATRGLGADPGCSWAWCRWLPGALVREALALLCFLREEHEIRISNFPSLLIVSLLGAEPHMAFVILHPESMALCRYFLISTILLISGQEL